MTRGRQETSGISVAIDALATYRLTKLLQQDTIPPLPKLRDKFMDKFGATPWGELATCVWCASIWCGALVAIARRVSPRLWDPIAATLAASAVTGITAELLDSQQPPEPVLRVVTSEER